MVSVLTHHAFPTVATDVTIKVTKICHYNDGQSPKNGTTPTFRNVVNIRYISMGNVQYNIKIMYQTLSQIFTEKLLLHILKVFGSNLSQENKYSSS